MTKISDIVQFNESLIYCMALMGSVVWLAMADAAAQTAPMGHSRTPSFGTVDPCAGTGVAGSSSYNACKLRQQTLSRGVVRAPDLSGLDRSKQLSVERVCGADLALGQAVYAACLRRELGAQRYDPNTPLRPLPDTQRQAIPPPEK